MTPKERDAMARKLGYKSFDDFAAKDRVYGKKARGPIESSKPTRNVFERIPGHPANTFRKISDTINKARGK